MSVSQYEGVSAVQSWVTAASVKVYNVSTAVKIHFMQMR